MLHSIIKDFLDSTKRETLDEGRRHRGSMRSSEPRRLGVVGEGNSQPTKRSGERRELPHWGPGQSPENNFRAFLSVRMHMLIAFTPNNVLLYMS